MIKVSANTQLAIDFMLEDYDTMGKCAEKTKIDFLQTLEACKTEEEIIQILIQPYTFYTDGPNTEPKREDIQRVIDKEGIVVDEVVECRWIAKDSKGRGVESPYPLLILPLNVRRNQQIIMKEGKSAKSDSTRNVSGQVTSSDRSGAFTDAEVAVTIGHSAQALQKEFMGFASADPVAKRKAMEEIQNKGYVSLKDLPDESSNKMTLLMLHHYYMTAGWDTDLIRRPKIRK